MPECPTCGTDAEKLGRNPDVHHIEPIRAFLETSGTTLADAHTIDNVVCLCPACHRQAKHGTVGAAQLRNRAGIEIPASGSR